MGHVIDFFYIPYCKEPFAFHFPLGIDSTYFWFGLYFPQTDIVRQEFSKDMSIQRAISIVFEQRPDLRFYMCKFFVTVSVISDLVTFIKKLMPL